MKHRSTIYTPGQRVETTMLTIIDSVDPSSWAMIRCRCDCGREIVLSYHAVYFCRYSCGCKRRPRADMQDYTGLAVTNKTGNRNGGRTLTVLYKDVGTDRWAYVCSCCAEIDLVSPGYDRGLARNLMQIAGGMCPHWLPTYYADRVEKILYECNGVGWYGPRVLGRDDQALWFAPYYEENRIVRNSKREIVAFKGLPRRHCVNEAAIADIRPETDWVWTARLKWEPRVKAPLPVLGQPVRFIPRPRPIAEVDAEQEAKAAAASAAGAVVPLDPEGFQELVPSDWEVEREVVESTTL